MAAETKIEWAHATFNPWRGCTKVAPGCQFCYAETQVNRFIPGAWGPNGQRVKTGDAYWKQPLKWNREAEKSGERRRVFCASLADVFEDWKGPIHDHNGARLMKELNPRLGTVCVDVTMDDLRADSFAVIDKTPWLDWLLLTKRPENIRRMMPDGPRRNNIWLGTSVSEQATADRNIPALLKCRDLSPVLFVSYEPALGPADVRRWFGPQNEGQWMNIVECGHARSRYGINWLIVGGESGPHARPCNVAWIRSARDQCAAAGVPCFVKQLGARPYDPSWHGDGTPEGSAMQPNDPKGGDWNEWPEDLRVRQFPNT